MKKTWMRLAAAALLLIFLSGTIAVLADSEATLLVYMSGASLESQVLNEIQDLQSGDFADRFNICVWAGGTNDWGIDYGLENGQLNQLVIGNHSYIEQNPAGRISVGSSRTLTDFIVTSIQRYPAERYFLILFNHGAGSAGGMMYDDVFNGEHLAAGDVKRALSQARQQLGTLKFDVVALHACLMGTVETLAAFQGYADYVVCTEELLLSDSLKGSDMLHVLREDPSKSSEELACTWLDIYEQAVEGEHYPLCVVDMSQMPPVYEALDEMLGRLAGQMDEEMAVQLSRTRADMRDLSSEGNEGALAQYWDTVDMNEFLAVMSSYDQNGSANVEELVSQAVIRSVTGREPSNAGIGIFFPQNLLRYGIEDRFSGYFCGSLPGTEDFVRQYIAFKEGRGRIRMTSGNSRTGEGTEEHESGAVSSQILQNEDESDQPASSGKGVSSLIVMGDESDSGNGEPAESGKGVSNLIVMGDESDSGNGEPAESGKGVSNLIVMGDESAEGNSEPAESGNGVSGLIVMDNGPAAEKTETDGTREERPTGSGSSLSQMIEEDVWEDSDSGDWKNTGVIEVSLSREDMATLSSVEASLTMVDKSEENPVYLDLGHAWDTVVDWETNRISSVFDGKWPSIDGQAVCVNNVYSQGETVYITVLAEIEEENVLLEYIFKKGSDEGKLLRAMDTSSENGSMALKLIDIRDDAMLQLRYPAYVYDADTGEETQIDMTGTMLSGSQIRTITRQELGRGMTYYYSFILTDISGNISYCDPVEIAY